MAYFDFIFVPLFSIFPYSLSLVVKKCRGKTRYRLIYYSSIFHSKYRTAQMGEETLYQVPIQPLYTTELFIAKC